MSTYPPDKWVMDSGTWGIDADNDTSQVYSGDYSVKLINSGNGVEMSGPATPIENSRMVRLTTAVRADANAAGNDIRVGLVEANSAGTVLLTTYAINGPVTAINTWEPKGKFIWLNGSTRNITPYIWKLTAFNAWIDHVLIAPVPAFCSAQMAASQTGLVSGSHTKVSFDTATLDPGVFWDTANKRFVAKYYSLWTFSASIYISTVMSDGKTAAVSLKKNGTTWLAWNEHMLSAARDPTIPITSGPVALNPGDYVEVQCWHNQGSNIAISNDSQYTWARAHELSQ